MLADAKVLITGAAKRVGRAIARELAGAGCHIAVHYKNSGREAEEVAAMVRESKRRAITVAGDLNDPQSWPRIVDQAVAGLEGLDILVNNASLFLTPSPDTIEQFAPPQWEEMLRVNLIAPAALCHNARSHLAASGRGRIINLTDISAVRPWKNHIAYCVSKAGLDALTKTLAVALAPEITVNGIALGIAIFPDAYSKELREQMTRHVPMKRQSSPEEVARFIRLVLESGSYLTGQVIAFDGGRSID